MESPAAVILAAGKSTRMKSALPKVLHDVCGRPMIEYVLDAATGAGVRRLVVVVGHGAEQVRAALSGRAGLEFALQAEQRGTGHAVMMCRDALAGHQGPVAVLMGDAPLLRTSSLTGLFEDAARGAACVVGTAVTDDHFGYGRIVRDERGEFLRIVEQKDATPEESRIREVNAGCYVFDGAALFAALDDLRPDNAQGEYYLTDCAALIRRRGKPVVASPRLEIAEAKGVNTREQLAEVNRIVQAQIARRWMAEGVTIVNPDQTWIDVRARIGAETVIEPFTVISGAASIGMGCRIGPHAQVRGASLPDGSRVAPFQVLGE